MKIMTKDHFWNKIKEESPIEFEKFSNWIDEYKLRIENKPLFNLFNFNINSVFNSKTNKETTILKYHDLTDAMQIGIFYQYTIENHPDRPFIIKVNDDISTIIENISNWFNNYQTWLKQQKYK